MQAFYQNHDSYVSRIGLDWEDDYDRIIDGDITDNGFNSYTGAINITKAGEYVLMVKVNGVDVTGYSVTIDVVPGQLHPASCAVKDELSAWISAGSYGTFRVQGRDQYHNNVETSILDSTTARSASLTSDTDTIFGTIAEYQTESVASFDGAVAYNPSGETILGVFVVQFAAPLELIGGGLFQPQLLLDSVTVPLPYEKTIQVSEIVEIIEIVASCPISNEFSGPIGIYLSNDENLGSISESFEYQLENTRFLLELGEVGSSEACGDFGFRLESPYLFLAMNEETFTVSVTLAAIEYETGFYEDAKVVVFSQEQPDVSFDIPITVYYSNPVEVEDIEDQSDLDVVEDYEDLIVSDEDEYDDQTSSLEVEGSSLSQTSTSSSKAASSTPNSPTEEVTEALGDLLGVENVEAAVKQSSAIDLDEPSTFDIEAYYNRLEGKKQTKGKTPPSFLLLYELEKKYAVPQSKSGIQVDGRLSMSFINNIRVQTPEELVDSFLVSSGEKSIGDTAERLRALQSDFVSDGNGGTVLQSGQELLQTQQLLKITSSIKCVMVPGDDLYLEKKGFNWELALYESNKFGIKFVFEHPEYISAGSTDSMKVQFFNTEKYLAPSNEEFEPLPDGYTAVYKISPQGNNLLSGVELSSAKSSAQSVMIGNLAASLILRQTMQMIIGSIIVIQILAHFPLTDISLPANAHQQFDIMIKFVSLDIFSPTEYVDVGFTPTEPWSEHFDWVGYGSVNFFENMGSIFVFAFLEIVLILTSVVWQRLRYACCRLKFRGKFLVADQAQNGLKFIHGTFFEILICVSVVLAMLPYWEWLNQADRISLYVAGFFALILAGYLLLVLYFVFTKAKLINQNALADKYKAQDHRLEEIHKEIFIKRFTGSESNQVVRLESLAKLEKRRKEKKNLVRSVSLVNRKSLEKYDALVSDLRQDSSAAFLNTVIISVRRCTLLYMAMYVVGQQWLQVLLFMSMNVISLTYIVAVQPFENFKMNVLSTLNEFFALLISYFIVQINNPAYGPEVNVQMGQIVVYVIYTSYACNGLLITYLSVQQLYGKIKSFFLRKCRRQPTQQPLKEIPKQQEKVEQKQLESIVEKADESDESDGLSDDSISSFSSSGEAAAAGNDQKIPSPFTFNYPPQKGTTVDVTDAPGKGHFQTMPSTRPYRKQKLPEFKQVTVYEQSAGDLPNQLLPSQRLGPYEVDDLAIQDIQMINKIDQVLENTRKPRNNFSSFDLNAAAQTAMTPPQQADYEATTEMTSNRQMSKRQVKRQRRREAGAEEEQKEVQQPKRTLTLDLPATFGRHQTQQIGKMRNFEI